MTNRIESTTGAEWRRLGFWYDCDTEHRTWRFVGWRAGLASLAAMLTDYAAAPASRRRDPLVVGPYGDFLVQSWDRPGIDDQGIHGPSDALSQLAGRIRADLATVAPGGTVEIGAEYGSDAEYTRVLDVRSDDFDPGAGPPRFPAVVHEERESPMPRSPTVPVRLHDPDALATESDGLIRLTDEGLTLQYETKDAFFGLYKSGVQELILPLTEIAFVEFKRGPFRTELAVQVNDLRHLDGVPGAKSGRLRLRFGRQHRGDAEALAVSLEELLRES